MRGKAAFVLGGIVGYALATKAGREQVTKVASQARALWDDPAVREQVSEAGRKAGSFVQGVVTDTAPGVAEKVAERVSDAVKKVGEARG